MALEIERKFLVDISKINFLENGEQIKQGFIATQDLTVVRVRISGEKAWLTIKGANKGATRSEFEYLIPRLDAEAMLAELCDKPILSKTRYRYKFGQHIWEVDVFSGENSGLVVAEVEMTTESDIILLPNWVTTEVTGDARYYNVNLVSHPYSKW